MRVESVVKYAKLIQALGVEEGSIQIELRPSPSDSEILISVHDNPSLTAFAKTQAEPSPWISPVGGRFRHYEFEYENLSWLVYESEVV